VPYSTLGYNHDRNYWAQWFPADFVTESFPGQFRNWFYALLAMSALMEGQAPFKVLLGHATVRDEKGEEMHKSKGNAIPFEDAAEKMGADVMRWMFCRNNPVNNINFGYGPADEVRNHFVFKLWNTYAFFCNYARLDGFDPAAAPVPVSERPDIDRWILSDLQLLVETARRKLEDYDTMTFCLAAETYVAEKLSNWYVRRNRRRFWKSEKSSDKLAAYQTLYTVLMTLTQLFAPIMPFLSESMYQNLEANAGTAGHASSVHLCDFPHPDESLIDATLSADTEALLRLVSFGLSARNAAKIKVRQPLAEIKILPASEPERRAIARFTDQISEELNVKKVKVHNLTDGPLLSFDVKPNLKTLGPRLGEKLKEVQGALASLDLTAMAAKIQAGESLEIRAGATALVLSQNDLLIQAKAADGWSGLVDGRTQIALDIRITEDLACEGTAREMVRHIQELRKNSGLEIEDRIRLRVETDSAAVRRAIEAHRDYICGETLAIEIGVEPLDGAAHKVNIKFQGQAVSIELAKVAPAAY
jgi:isoleucyl-tRNA synthetase